MIQATTITIGTRSTTATTPPTIAQTRMGTPARRNFAARLPGLCGLFAHVRAAMLALDRHRENLLAAVGASLGGGRTGRSRPVGIVVEVEIVQPAGQLLVLRAQDVLDASVEFLSSAFFSTAFFSMTFLSATLGGAGAGSATGMMLSTATPCCVGDLKGRFLVVGRDHDRHPLARRSQDALAAEFLFAHDIPCCVRR